MNPDDNHTQPSRFEEPLLPGALPPLVRQLGDRRKSESAFDQLLRRGPEAVALFLQILALPRDLRVTGWDAPLARRRAAEGLGRLKAGEGVELLLEALQDPDGSLRVKIIWALGEIRDARAVPALLPWLEDKELRAEVIWALGEIGGVQAVSALLPLLVDEVLMTKWPDLVPSALRKSLQSGEGEQIDVFLRTLQGEPNALEELKRRGWPQVVGGLIRVLEHSNPAKVIHAARALGELGAVEALPHLQAKLSWFRFSPAQVKEACIQAIDQLEALAVLPRPAGAPEPAIETLPRPASEPEPNKETLPRPAREETA